MIDAVIFYWRPGCEFCASLRLALDKLDIPLKMHNIWEDPDAAAVVRSLANGNETVPTVVVGDISLVNPTPDEVIEALARC